MWFLILWIALFVVGYIIIFFSADFFIDNLKDLCIIYDISPFIIGLIVLGVDPEESIASIVAAINGLPYIAVGNVIGADILNVLFVAGSAASVTNGGLQVPVHFFKILFPAMLMILIIFRIGIFYSGKHLKRPFGLILLCFYIFVTLISYTH